MATSPRKPSTQRGTEPTTELRGAVIMDSPLRPRATVKIESMTKGMPKVIVSVDDDDPDAAMSEALRVYYATLEHLRDSLPGILGPDA